jgi:tRNA(adenine34) deaminase
VRGDSSGPPEKAGLWNGDPKGGAVDSLYRLLQDSRLNHFVEVTGASAGILHEILSGFFREKR